MPLNPEAGKQHFAEMMERAAPKFEAPTPDVNERLYLLRLWHALKQDRPHEWPEYARGFAAAIADSVPNAATFGGSPERYTEEVQKAVFAVHLFVKSRVRYRKDPAGRDDWKPPSRTLADGGDCEDLSIVAKALLDRANIASRLLVGMDLRRQEAHAVLAVVPGSLVIDAALRTCPVPMSEYLEGFTTLCDLPTDFDELQRRIVGDG